MALPCTKIGVLFKPTARPSLYLYLSLRLLQFGAAALTLSYFCSLIGWHRAHYCSKRFYKDECSQVQQDYARVPTLYIIFVSMYCFMILSAFGLSYRQLSLFLSFATSSKSSIGPSDGDTDNSNHDASPIFKLCRQALGYVPNSLLIDLAVLIVLSLCLNEYWTSIIRPNHIHPGSGYAFPVCWLFEWTGPADSYYWKNLKVEKQRCMDNQISFYATIGVVVFTSLLVVVDAFYLHHDWSTKKAVDDDVLIEASDKPLLIDITA